MDSKFTLIHRQSDALKVNKLEGQGVPPLLAGLYASRGVTDIKEIDLRAEELLPTATLKNSTAMGFILADCVADQKRLLIISDYDCDGATAGSVLIEAFGASGMNFGYLVPDRLKHGYGLTPSIVDEAAALVPKPDFIITVDNGISSHAGVERAREHGIEVLVTDHHLCPEKLPNARLIVNPQQPGDNFESKNIAGCGVAWYVARSLYDEMTRRHQDPGFDPMSLTPFVALGTVADVVLLDRNNRIMISEGLKRIRSGECTPGILALANVAKRNHELLTCTDIGFAVGPRINAAGRMAHMSSGIECLTTHDADHALVLAMALEEINRVRRDLQKGMIEEANSKADKIGIVNENSMSLVVYERDWHEGVVGIVAGRLKDEKNRPTFVMCQGQDGSIKGSGRSIDGFHLKHALDEINITRPGLLLKFGGHAMAAGATIDPNRLDEFKEALESICKAHITPAMLEQKLYHDGAIPAKHLNPDDVRMMDLQVWGQGFSPPIFLDEFTLLGSRQMGKEGQEKDHLKLTVSKNGARFDVVAFNEGARHGNLPKTLELVFRPSINEWNGNVSVQLMAEHFVNAPALQANLEFPVQVAPATSKSIAPAETAKKVNHKEAAKKELDKDPSVGSRFSAMIAQQRKVTEDALARTKEASEKEDMEAPVKAPSSARRVVFR